MANWRKKEAGFMVISNKANDAQFFCEKFHNINEMQELEQKYKWINANIEHYIGSFANNAEIEQAIEEYKLKNGANKEFFTEPEEQGPDRVIPCPYPRLVPVTEGMFLDKWTKFKEDGGVLYTKYEAWEKDLRYFWSYNETMLPEGHARIKKLVLQNKLTTDEDKLFFWTVVYEPAKIGGK